MANWIRNFQNSFSEKTVKYPFLSSLNGDCRVLEITRLSDQKGLRTDLERCHKLILQNRIFQNVFVQTFWNAFKQTYQGIYEWIYEKDQPKIPPNMF